MQKSTTRFTTGLLRTPCWAGVSSPIKKREPNPAMIAAMPQAILDVLRVVASTAAVADIDMLDAG